MSLTACPAPYLTVEDANGHTVSGAKIYTLAAGGTWPGNALATYADAAGATPNANPVIADSSGRAVMFMLPASYKLIITTAADAAIKTVDNLLASSSFDANVDIEGIAGQTLAARSVVYLAPTGGWGGTTPGYWYLTDSDAPEASSIDVTVGVVPATIANGATGAIRLQGRLAGYAGLTPGARYYCSGTPGGITATAPTNRRSIGVADLSTSLMIQPTHSEGLILTPNGTAAVPAWTFTADLDTGLYRVGANEIGITCGGENAATFTVSSLKVTGRLIAYGFGSHEFIAGGTGANTLIVQNSTAGAANYAQLRVGCETGTVGTLSQFSAGFSTTGFNIAGCTQLRAGLGDLVLVVDDPLGAGALRMYLANPTALRSTLQATGLWQWHAYGAGAATFDAEGNITSVSDARFKDRIAPLPYGLAEVLRLRPVQHGYNALSQLEREHLYGGFLAQDVQAVMPLAVGVDARGYLTLADRPILGAVVHAIQTIDERVSALERVAGW